MEIRDAFGLLERRLDTGPLLPDGEGRVRLHLAGGLAMSLIPAPRGQLVAEVGLERLPAEPERRRAQLELMLGRALALMKEGEEVVALDEAQGQLVVWRLLDLPALQPAAFEEAVVLLLERAEWLSGQAAPAPVHAPGPMLFFP